ncbi:hypothetical protein [Capnocytophaga catalasegens]|uniref:DUF4468 domain-containing protein n=1 Tax=Capnocytophaga catalasegens TaxID=1004260 RepID=A0AAV5AZ08_9FLAO|nr:hypothetical protein [Capnocytophaga catalasegens]GIZ16038.1 hypothetical protein RCZ03_20380 [Capnocytophaga catalasegens]GJM51256.1 hypothetical protein RCZ15_22290 [Capnocytophaga catalasegens]GJM53338.1 hypothetical protein RCZ16_16550 [Capnocytophaga catalasegens]
MKKILFLLLLINSSLSYSQKDTITVRESNIAFISQDIYIEDPRIGILTTDVYILKEEKTPLNGFYKVIINNDYFYTLAFDKGSKILNNGNIIKYYKNNKIYKLDIYYPTFYEHEYYYTIEPFNCDVKKTKVYIKYIENDSKTKSIFRARQIIDEKYIVWTFIKKNHPQSISFLKERICNCDLPENRK